MSYTTQHHRQLLTSYVGTNDFSSDMARESNVTKEYEIEGRYNWRGPPYQMIMLCRRYSIWIRNICLMYNYHVHNNLFWIFHIQMEYRLQSMNNHMVGRAPRQLYLPSISYSLNVTHRKFAANFRSVGHVQHLSEVANLSHIYFVVLTFSDMAEMSYIPFTTWRHMKT